MEDRLDILTVDLLSREKLLVNELKRLAHSLRLEFGWHYLLDLAWILSQLGPAENKRIIDAGAGMGIMQWYLAGRNAEVISVDRMDRSAVPPRFKERFEIHGLREGDLIVGESDFSLERGPAIIRNQAVLLSDRLRTTLYSRNLCRRSKSGRVILYNQDLMHLMDIPDESVDSIVAVSALEHNPPEDLRKVVSELLRVLKHGGAILATLCAARDADWYHEPSRGWCYSEATLREIFDLPPEVKSNYDQYDSLLASLRDCRELRDNLARFYFRSGDNGMPWGIWDPQYQPVGVCKVKRT
jgi:SAM-dependent methyltransferase